jgi:hypothetical protein
MKARQSELTQFKFESNIMNKCLYILVYLFFLSNVYYSQSSFGDSLYSFNAGVLTPSPDRNLAGIEFAEGYFWITGFDPPSYDHKLYKVSADGSTLVDVYPQGTGYHAWLDLAYDGEYLYVVDKDSIVQIDLDTGYPTGYRIYVDFGYLLAQGLAYDPGNDRFWVMPQRNGQTQIFYEIDRSGNVLRTFANNTSDYTVALTWDTLSPGGPFLWTYSREEFGYNTRAVMRQFNPATGTFTGIEFQTENRSSYSLDYPLGLTLTDEIIDGQVTIAALQGGNLNIYDGLDWVVVYDADLSSSPAFGPSISVTPASIQNQLQYGDTMLVDLTIQNSGNSRLDYDAYIENIPPNNITSGNLGDTLNTISLFDSTGNRRYKSIEFLDDHFWVLGNIYPSQSGLFKFDREGNYISTILSTSSSYNNLRSLTSDGNNLYITDTYTIRIWSPDSNRFIGFIFKGSFSADAFAVDPATKNFYLSNSNGGVKVLDSTGTEINFIVTGYSIEGLAWDKWSPGGPYLWAWIEDSLAAEGSRAVRLNPSTGISTGAAFEGVSAGNGISVPEGATISPDYQDGKLVLLALQDNDQYGSDYEASIVSYDLAVTPPPDWITLVSSPAGSIDPGGTDNLSVRLTAIMGDTLTSAVIKIFSNDIINPQLEIPVDFLMLASSPVPVELAAFRYEIIESGIKLIWRTITETNNKGFEIHRNGSFLEFIPGNGSSTEVNEYTYTDNEADSGINMYKLIQIDLDGTQVEAAELEVNLNKNDFNFSLEQNYPNPFNPTTSIQYRIPEYNEVVLKVFDLLGNEVKTLVNEFEEAGKYEIVFDASGLASGIYFYRLSSGGFAETRKLLLLK